MQAHLKGAVGYHYGAFPPKDLRAEQLLNPVFETGSVIARYDQMLSAMHNS